VNKEKFPNAQGRQSFRDCRQKVLLLHLPSSISTSLVFLQFHLFAGEICTHFFQLFDDSL